MPLSDRIMGIAVHSIGARSAGTLTIDGTAETTDVGTQDLGNSCP